MAWIYSGAFLHQATVRVVVEETSDPANVQIIEHRFTKQPTQTNAQFVAMVRAEVRTWLDTQNAAFVETDVTAQFTPP